MPDRAGEGDGGGAGGECGDRVAGVTLERWNVGTLERLHVGVEMSELTELVREIEQLKKRVDYLLTLENAAGAGGGHVIQDEGAPLAQRANLNFVGAGVTASDDLPNNATVVTVPGGGGGAHDLLSATHPDTTPDSVVEGDVLYGDTPPKWTRLPHSFHKPLMASLDFFTFEKLVSWSAYMLNLNGDFSTASAISFADATAARGYAQSTAAGAVYWVVEPTQRSWMNV